MKAMDGLAHAGMPAAGSSWSLFDLVGSGVAVTAPDGTLEFCNTALLQLLAQDANALLGTSMFELLRGQLERCVGEAAPGGAGYRQ